MPETRTAAEVFTESRTVHAGSVANHRPNQAGFACPKCELRDPPELNVPVTQRVGARFAFQCANGHEYLDNDELMSLKPRMLEVKQQVARQEGYETIPISIPSTLRQALLARLGTPEKVAATLSAVMFSLAEPRTFLINAMDAQRLGQILGQDVVSGPSLVGLIFKQNEDIKEFREKVQKLEQAALVSQGRTTVHASEPSDRLGVVKVDVSDLYDKVLEYAFGRGQTAGQVIHDCVATAIDRKCCI